MISVSEAKIFELQRYDPLGLLQLRRSIEGFIYNKLLIKLDLGKLCQNKVINVLEFSYHQNIKTVTLHLETNLHAS